MILRSFRKVADNLPNRTLSVKEKRRRLRLELLEERRLLAVGPQLLGIDHNNGVLIQEGSVHNTAPKELTFRFDEGQVLDRATLGAIRLLRSGLDGVFDNGNDVTINPGFLDLGQTSFTVVMRFAQTLPDDLYRIDIAGTGSNPLRNTAGLALGDTTMDGISNGSNFSLKFDLQLGAQVISVVPQPITRNPGTGVLSQAKDKIEVYFNNDQLDPTKANNPAYYRLIDTQDQSLLFPQSVVYDAAQNKATLTFPSDLSTATFKLQIGATEESNSTAVQATDLGTIAQQAPAAVYSSQIVTDSNGNPIPTVIPDNGSILSAISVLDSFLVSDVNVDVNINHTWGPDLRVFLQGPAGQRIELIRDLGTDLRGGQIYGVKYDDANGNGVRDAGELGLAGWTIFLDNNANGELDPGERSTVTDSQGRYSFLNLTPGQSYQLVQIPQTFWRSTSPAGGASTQFFSTDFSSGGQQTLRLTGNPLSGTFRLGFSGRSTSQITFAGAANGATTASNIRQALIGILDPGTSVAVTPVSGTEFTLAFTVSGVGTSIDHPALIVVENLLNVGQPELFNTGDSAGFTSAGSNNLWHLSSGRGNNSGHTPQHSFYFGQNETAVGGGAYTDNANGTLRSPEIDLTDPTITGPVTLRLNHFLSTEAGFDFAEIRAVADGQTTVLLRTSTNTTGFQALQFDLTQFAGRRIFLEFNFTSDVGVTPEGWYVDDIRIELARSAQSVALGSGPQQQVVKDIDFGSVRRPAAGPDAFGYRAYSVTTNFEDISTTGTRVLQSIGGNGAAFQVGGGGDDVVSGMARDAAGNLYLAGSFQGTVDFDPGAGTTSLTSTSGDDVFVAKYDSNGALVWARQAGGSSSDVATSVAVDGAGNVIVSGSFNQTASFGGTNLTSNGLSDAFVWKLDSTGGTLWARGLGGTAADSANSVDVAANGDVLATGAFSNTVDFDPGAGTQNQTSAGGTDVFVLRLNSSGNFVWVRQMGGAGIDGGEDVHVTAAGNVVTTGSFNGTVDFNPGAATSNLTSLGGADGFVQQLNSAGNFTWAQRFGVAATSDSGNDVASDAGGNVFMTGFSNGDIIVQRMNAANGASLWSRTIGGTATDRGEAINISANGIVSVAGSFRSTVNFGGGNRTAVGGSDAFVLRLDSQGNYVAASTFGGTADDSAFGIQRDATGTLFAAGTFRGTVAFDVGTSTPSLTSNGGTDVFFARIATPAGLDDGTFQLTPADLNGFQFNFYGTNYSGLFFSSNGLISFGAANASSSNTNLLSTPTEAVIAAFWEDLRTGAADSEAVFWQVVGTGNDQRLIVQWSNVLLDNANALAVGPLNFQAILSERDGSIQLNYQSVAPPQIISAGPERQVGTFTKGSQVTPAIASDAAGNYVIVWNSPNQDGDGDSIFGRRYNAAGVAQGTEFQINTTATGSQSLPHVAMNASGRFVVTWTGNGVGDSSGVFARIYDAAGNPVTSEFVVHLDPTGTQANGVGGMDTAGNIAIAWHGQGTDSADGAADVDGVFVRRFDPAGQPLGQVDEIQRMRLLAPPAAGSSFTLFHSGVETPSIVIAGVATATAANIATALGGLVNTVVTALPTNNEVQTITLNNSTIRNEVQTLTFTGGPTGGTFTIGFNALTTAAITFAGVGNGATTASNIQAALAALATIGAGNVTVAQVGNSDTLFTITFGGTLSGTDVSLLTLNQNNLTPGGTFSFVETTKGVPDGNFRLTFDRATTLPINVAGNVALNIQTALEALANIGTGNVTVTAVGNSLTQYRVTFVGARAGTDQPLLAVGSNNLAGTVSIVETTIGATLGQDFEIRFQGNGGGRNQALLTHGSKTGGVTHIEVTSVQEGSNGEVRVNNERTSAQINPRLDMAPTGEFTISWSSNLQDGSQNGVFAKRYSANGLAIAPEADEIQRLTLEGPPAAGSNFSLRIATATTGNIVYAGPNSGTLTANRIQTALRNLPRMADVTVTAVPGVSQEIQRLDFVPLPPGGAPGGGTFRLGHRGQVTAPIVFAGVASADATTTATNIQNALRALPNLAPDLVTVVATPIGANFDPFQYTVTFTGAAGTVDHPPLVLAARNFNQGTMTVTTIDDGGKSPNQFIVGFGLTSGRTDQPNIVLVNNTGGVPSILVDEVVRGVNSEFQVNSTTLSDQQANDVVIRADGSYFVVWQSNLQDGDSIGVFGKLYSSTGAVLRDEFQINTFTQGSQSLARAGADSLGNIVVTWVSAVQDGSSNGVYARRLGPDGFPLGDEFQVHTSTAGSQTSPSIVVNPNGTFVIAFSSAAVGGGIHAQRFSATGAKVGVEDQISQFGVRLQSQPEIARSSNGTYVVVWTDTFRDIDNSAGVFAQVYDASNNPVGAEFQVNQLTINEQTAASVDIDDTGRFVVVWRTLEPGPNNTTVASIRGRRFDATGAPLSGEFQISTAPVGVNSVPDVDVDGASGKWVVVWNQSAADFFNDSVLGRVYAADGTPQTAELTLQSSIFFSEARVALHASGEFTVVWLRLGTSFNFNVEGRVFNANGTPKTTLIPINASAPNAAINDFEPDVVVDSTGISTVVWTSSAAGDHAVIRRFDANANPLTGETVVSSASGVVSPRISIAQDNSFVVSWFNAAAGTIVQRFGPTGGAIGTNSTINDNNSPNVAAGNSGQFLIASLDGVTGSPGGVFVQGFTSDAASVGIKSAGAQSLGGNTLPVWVDGSLTTLVGNNSSLRIARVVPSPERLFAVNGATNSLVELHSFTGATIRSSPLPVAAGSGSGLAFAGGTVYFIPSNGSALYELDPDTGGTVDVVPLSGISSSGLSGLAYLNGEVVLLDATANRLIFIDPFRNVELRRITPAATLAGGLVGGGNRGTLFAINAAAQVVELNASTGSVVRTIPSPGASLVGLALVDGVLLASNSAGVVHRINPDTGTVLGTLTVPSGLSALGADGGGGFANALGGDYQPFVNTILDDEASLSITEGVGPFTGRYRPAEPLSLFDGTNVRGLWQLQIQDTATGNTGVLHNWRLRINELQDTPPDVQYVGFVGDNTDQSVAAANDIDVYKFNVLSGGSIRIDAKPGASLNLAMRLFDAQGNEVTRVNAAGVGGTEQLNFLAPGAGVYFVGISSSGNTAYNVVSGSGSTGGASTGSYSLDLRFNQPVSLDDNNSSFDTATAIGAMGVGTQTIRSQILSAVYAPILPGGLDEPGHRHIQPETHLLNLAPLPAASAIPTAFYNFQNIYGVLPSGAAAVNAITAIQKQRAREIFELYSRELGIQFIETVNEGLTVVTGDLRAIDPTAPGGPGGVAGISEGTLTGRVIMDAAENWGDSEYGGGWFQTAMHEIGHSLGLGHAYELPNLTIQGGFGTGEPVFPGDHDLVHGRFLYKPASIDQDLYRFTLNEDGILSAETIAERIAPNASLLDTVISIYAEVGVGRRELIARNDDYFSNDSFLSLHLSRGTYFIDVSAAGNSRMDPAVSDTGFGGTSQGDYELVLSFTPDRTTALVDTDGVALDGDADGVPGGRFNFYFESGPTIFVDRLNDTTPGLDGNGSLSSPLDNIFAATELARSTLVMPRDGAAQIVDGESFVVIDLQNRSVRLELDNNGFSSPGSIAIPFVASMTGSDLANAIAAAVNTARTAIPVRLNVTPTVVGGLVRLAGTTQVDATGSPSLLRSPSLIRIVGNGGADRNTNTLFDNVPYLIGLDGTVALRDGDSLEVPQGVTVMIDAGTLFKMRQANFDVGTSAIGVDRSGGALQVLGTPREQVSVYSYRNDAVGGDSDGPGAPASSGDWGGLVFREDSDMEESGIFLNWVNNATLDSGGGKLFVESVERTFTPIHMIGARPTISFNTIRRSADAAISADPASFSDEGQRIGPEVYGNFVVDNSINGLFVRIDTQLGATINTISLPSRWDDTDIVHVITENLLISATPGGPQKNPATGVIGARLDGRLTIDPGIIVKLQSARTEVLLGGQLIAEGTQADPIIFTTLTNDSYGGSGTFDTKNDLRATTPAPGQWGGVFFGASAQGSFDRVLVNYGGGLTPVEGGFERFNVLEIHQADVRLTNSIVQDNASGLAATTRNGRGSNAAATVFVRGAQPVIVNNLFQNNAGTVIHINANSLQSVISPDYGRTTGELDVYDEFADNYGPLVRLNRLQNNQFNGMDVRSGVLTTESVWDDTDIAHILRGEISVLNHHTFSGLHLLSSDSQSLVVKLAGTGAGFTANGTLLDIDDRIGGSIYIGARGLPVVLTSLADDTAIAGVNFFGLPLGDTNNDGNATQPAPGNWRSILLDRFSNDRNVELLRETERAFSGLQDLNRRPADAQFLGNLAPDEKSGDVDRRLGFEIHGNISVDNSRDVDVYSFNGVAGTEVFFDIDHTGSALDSMLELIDAAGNVLARSIDASNATLSGFAQPLLKASHLGHDFYSITTRDPAMRAILPGVAGQTNTYFVRVRSNSVATDLENINGGLTRGDYKVQIRLRQVDEKPGSFIRNADIRFATNGIQVIGLPQHSPLIGESVETRAGNDGLGAAQPLGNLLTSDRNTISVGGNISSPTDVDWYRFELDYDLIQSIGGFNNGGKTFATIFDIDYADGLGRPDTVISVFDAAGNLVMVSRDSNVEDDQPGAGQGADVDDLSRGTFGTQDAYIGSVQMPAGVPGSTTTFYVAVSSNSELPAALNGTFTSAASNTLVRLEPINSLTRIAEDHIGFQGYTSGTFALPVPVPPKTPLFNISSSISLAANVVPITLNEVTLFTATPGTNGLKTVNPFTGTQWTNVGNLPTGGPARIVGDLAMRSDGRLFAVEGLAAAANNTAGQLVELDPSTGAVISVIGTDGIPDFDPATAPPNLEQLTSSNIDALAWQRTGGFVNNLPDYNLYYSIQGARRGQGVDGSSSTLYRADPANGSAAVVQGQPWGRRGEIFATTPGDLGQTTGMAFVGGQLFGVSNSGAFYSINLFSGRATILANPGTPFSGLAQGPQNAESGRYANMLFALASDGTIFAFSTTGAVQSVFSNGTSASTGNPFSVGLAFSTADFNLWHPTFQRRTDPGHGINAAFDNSRTPLPFTNVIGSNTDFRTSNEAQGGASFRFGLSQWVANPVNSYITYGPNSQLGILSENAHRDLSANPQIVNNYNLPGGAIGSLKTNTISLNGYAAADKPTLYFNYFLESEDVNTNGVVVTNGSGSTLMRDSARVLVSRDGGTTWELLATNNSILSTAAITNELPRFISPNVEASTHPRQQVQELFDNTGGWRQARIDLSNYAGVAQLQFRFDFSSAGAIIGPNGTQASGLQSNLGSLFSNRRGQLNSFEGFYVDDVIVGFSERGEIVTNSQGQQQFFTIPPNPEPSDPSQILVGQYQLEIRRGTEFAETVDDRNPNIYVFQTFDTNDRLVNSLFRLGDSNLHREQGQILIANNTISDSLEFAIIADAGARDAGGSLSRPGGVRNLPTDNNERITAGTKIENNILANFGLGGIRFSGDPNSGTLPLSSVPFGRIVNNTIYGGDAARGTGIEVSENASPTILNNIIANTVGGLSIDATSASTVVGANLYKGNTNNGTLGQNALTLLATDPLFVNALQRNFYPAQGTLAIDSSLNSLADRANFAAVNSPLGIPLSPILAPDRDRFAQLRLDDPGQDPPPGLGSNIFKDRGAVERADFGGPTARLIEPLDNDGLGLDLNPIANEVLIQPTVISQIAIQLTDQGIGIDDSSVTVGMVQVFLDGQLLTPGTGYEFVYNATNNLIILRNLKNNGPVSNRYEILLANRPIVDIRDLAGNPVLGNQPSGATRFIVITGGSIGNQTIPDFTLATNQVSALEDNELELGGIPQTKILNFAGNLPPVPGIGEPPIVFATTSITNASMFTQAPAIDLTGALTFKTAPDRNGTSVIVMRLTETGTSNPKQSGSQTFTITLAPINDAPSFTLPATLDVFEDQGSVTIASFAAGFGPGPVTAIDEANQALTIETKALDPSAFTVQPSIDNSGTLRFQTRPDFNSAVSTLLVTLAVTDNGPSTPPNKNRSATRTFTINVVPVNDPPSFNLTRTLVNVVEDEEAFKGIPQSEFPGFAANIAGGPPTALDEVNQIPTFTVTASRPELFSQQPAIDANGKLTFRTAPDGSGNTLVVVQLSDSGLAAPPPNQNTSSRVTFTVSISPVNDAPEFTLPSSFTVQEDAGLITQTGFATNIRRGPVGAVDESAQLLNFEVFAVDPNTFAIQPAIAVDGVLSFQTAENVNSSNADLRVRVRLMDNGLSAPPPNTNQSAFKTFSLVVNPVNDAPIPNAYTIAGVEDTNVVIQASDVLVGDLAGPTVDEQGQTLRMTQVERATARGGVITATFSGSTITSMVYSPPVNLFGEDTFLYVVTDDGSPNRSGTGTITISISPINDPPQFSKGPDQVVQEDAGTISVPGWATDILAGPLTAGDEIAGQTVGFELVADNPGLFEQLPTVAADGTLRYKTAKDANGSSGITVVAVDSGSGVSPNRNRSNPATFRVTVNPSNDAPAFTAGPTVTVAEDSSTYTQPWATNIAPAAGLLSSPPTANDESAQVIDFLVTVDRPALFSTQPSIGSNGVLSFTLAPNASGVALVTVVARDRGPSGPLDENTSAAQTLTISISATNDAPTAVADSLTTSEDAVLRLAAPGLLANDTDTDLPGDTLAAIPASLTSTQGAAVTIAADGSIVYDPTSVEALQRLIAGQVSTDTFTYRVRDTAGAQSALATVTVNVTGVNDAPVAVDDRFSVPIGSARLLDVLANDSDVDSPIDVRTIVIGSLPAFGTIIVNPTGVVEYTPGAGFRGTETFSYRVNDNTGKTSNEAFVTIAVNSAPVASDDAAVTVKNAPVTINVLANDSDSDGTLNPASVQIVVIPSPSGTVVVQANGSVRFTPATDFFGTARFSYVVSDNVGTASNVANVQIQVLRSRWQNSLLNLDVSGDGFVSPIDALLVINYINSGQPSFLPSTNIVPPPFYDTNGDEFVTAIDALLVINFLNTQPSGEGEGNALGSTSFVNMVSPEAVLAAVGPQLVREARALLDELRANELSVCLDEESETADHLVATAIGEFFEHPSSERANRIFAEWTKKRKPSEVDSFFNELAE